MDAEGIYFPPQRLLTHLATSDTLDLADAEPADRMELGWFTIAVRHWFQNSRMEPGYYRLVDVVSSILESRDPDMVITLQMILDLPFRILTFIGLWVDQSIDVDWSMCYYAPERLRPMSDFAKYFTHVYELDDDDALDAPPRGYPRPYASNGHSAANPDEPAPGTYNDEIV